MILKIKIQFSILSLSHKNEFWIKFQSSVQEKWKTFNKLDFFFKVLNLAQNVFDYVQNNIQLNLK